MNNSKPTGKETNKHSNKIKQAKGDHVLQVVCIIVIILFCIFCVMPFLYVAGSSFEKEANITKYGFTIIPKNFTLKAYMQLFEDKTVYNAYATTIFTTLVGTVAAMLVTVMMAYPLSLKKLKFRNFGTFFVYFTMLFNGGLVPSYILISKYLNMKDSIWVLIIPTMFSGWNMFLMRNFFSGIPIELSESAKIDGANDMKILFRIILPVSKPGLATIAMFYALGYWNQWYNAMLYFTSNSRKFFPLQYLIMDLTRTTDALKLMSAQTGVAFVNLPQNSLKMAMTLVTIGPIILVYPFAQKYFTTGLTVGSIKG